MQPLSSPSARIAPPSDPHVEQEGSAARLERQRRLEPASARFGAIAAPRRRVDLPAARERTEAAARQALGGEAPAPGCLCMRHWSELPVWGIGVLGVALVAMGVFGGPAVYYVAGGIDLAAAVPLFPIVRRYGTVRQQVGLLQEVIERQRELLDDVQEQLANLDAQVDRLAENESEISEHVDVLTDGIVRLRDAARGLGNRIEASRSQRDQLAQATTAQTEQLGALRQQLQERTEELHALQETVQRLYGRPEELLRAIEERSRALRELGAQIEQTRPEIQGERGLLAALEEAVAGQSQIAEIQHGIRGLAERLDLFTTEIDRTADKQVTQLARMQEQREALSTGLPQLQHELDELEARLRELRPESDSQASATNELSEGRPSLGSEAIGSNGSGSLAF